MTRFDFAVIGAGIAGLATAAALSREGRVALVEQEEQPCYHSSGRSAAIFVRSYGSAAVQALTARSATLFAEAEAQGLFTALAPPRGVMVVVPHGSEASGEAPFRTRIDAHEAAALMPCLDPVRLDHAWWEPSARDIDVHAMQTGYLRELRAAGGELIAAAPLSRAEHRGKLWHLTAGVREIAVPIVVNAAGAWADPVARLFGAAPLGIRPLRRSAAVIDVPERLAPGHWPMIVDADETVYFKPEAGRLMLSPADSTPVEPHDCWPEDLDIAIAVDRYERLTGASVHRVHHRWAGLRSFAVDENPVIGTDPSVPGLYWAAGLGGFGVQTAPAIADFLLRLVIGSDTASELQAAIDPGRIEA
ncbi:MAG: FAD-binding oxidoreductase [Novosphingobium sp.]|nr:FAD-binding oxidoreductase [Novosphingobium sp.]